MSTPNEHDLVTLNREIAQLETDAARLEIERAAAANSVRRLRRRKHYLNLARWLRKPAASHAAFRLAVLTIGPLFVGVVAFVLLSLTINFWTLAAGGFLVSAILALVALAALLYNPSDTLLPPAIAEAGAKLNVEDSRLRDVVSTVAEVNGRLATLREHRQEFAKSGKLQRAMLLQRPWKSLSGGEWEDYVVEVCRTLGANVQRVESTGTPAVARGAPATGPRGVIRRAPTTLFVTFSPRRIAVAAISEVNPFHAAAVRQVIDDLATKGCDELGILTNARITVGSKEYARSRRCTLIGEEEFPDFVLGKLPL